MITIIEKETHLRFTSAQLRVSSLPHQWFQGIKPISTFARGYFRKLAQGAHKSLVVSFHFNYTSGLGLLIEQESAFCQELGNGVGE